MIKEWPEIPVPTGHQHCHQCELHTHGTRMVWGEGNPEAKIMLLLDNPGSREDKEGNPFVCGTRRTLQEAALEAGFDSTDFYMTYLLKRRPTKKYDKETTRKSCFRQHLADQLNVVRPMQIMVFGNVAVKIFFDDPNAEVKTLRGKVHQVRGIDTVVTYHPLAVRRRPNLMHLFKKDWELFKHI